MKGYVCIVFVVLFGQLSFAHADSVVIKGIAPDYISQQVAVYQIDDYLTMTELMADSSTVQTDSTFSLRFIVVETQKVVLRIGNNHSFLYVQPGGNYLLYVPLHDPYTPYRPAGSHVEITFLDIDSNDVNFKILSFNGWFDNYIALNYKDSQRNPEKFYQSMNDFKDAAQKFYEKDTGAFIFDYVRFAIANNDNLLQIRGKNRYEKHDFYLKFQPILYRNDVYMDYFKTFYKGMFALLTTEVGNRVYLGLLKNSPSAIMNALGKEYTLINTRIRELVMIQMLSDLYHTPEYPQSNVLEVLDSIQHHALFSAHKHISTKRRIGT